MRLLDPVRIALLAFFTAILQVSAAPQLTPTNSSPDLVLVLVLALALFRGPESAAIAGFAAGLLVDAVTGQRLGVSSLLYVVAAWAVARRAHGGDDTLMAAGGPVRLSTARRLLYAVAATLGVQVGYALLLWLLGEGLPFRFTIDNVIVPVTIMTTIAAALLLPLLQRALPRQTGLDVRRAAAA
jgi:cell shape-determining protein MreD